MIVKVNCHTGDFPLAMIDTVFSTKLGWASGQATPERPTLAPCTTDASNALQFSAPK